MSGQEGEAKQPFSMWQLSIYFTVKKRNPMILFFYYFRLGFTELSTLYVYNPSMKQHGKNTLGEVS